jgi:hypothetical protein
VTATPETSPPVDSRRVAWLVAGGLALVGGTLLGWNSAFLEALATPPALIRAGLVAGAVVLGLWLLAEAMRRMGASRGRAPDATSDATSGELSTRDLAGLVRGVRLVFLAVAAFAAAIGWLVGHPLPFIVALVIAGVDILETSFLLLVVALRRD